MESISSVNFCLQLEGMGRMVLEGTKNYSDCEGKLRSLPVT
jgi:hypothetical protein